MASIVFNGVSREIAEGTNLQHLLDSMNLDARQVAVERNREIVIRNRYAQTELQNGDRLEVVTFVGGG